MAQFNLENEISAATRMDAPLSRGPAFRWERKNQANTAGGNRRPLETSFNLSQSLSMSQSMHNQSLSTVLGLPGGPPTASSNHSSGHKTPSGSRSTTPTRHSKTPNGSSSGGRKTPNKSPGRGGGEGSQKQQAGADRFIPCRSTTQFELGNYKLTSAAEENAENDEEGGACASLSPQKLEYQKKMSQNLNGGCDLADAKILSYAAKPPSAPEGYQNQLRVLYSQSKASAAKNQKPNRHIPSMPERILDAPNFLDDYYLNLLDWSSTNILAVGLSDAVYTWNAETGNIDMLMEAPEDREGGYPSAISWSEDGNFMAIGTSWNEVELWDVNQKKKLRTMAGHTARIGALSWNSFLLASGSRSGAIHHHDVRVANHLQGQTEFHTQDVCGLKWSYDKRHLASGGNDNVLAVWTADPSASTPVHTFTQHQSAVKAVSWCPWQNSLLASGGGTADRCIRFWNVNTGTCLNSIDTKSQVCSIAWNTHYREIVSSHGFAHNQLILWKYPSMTRLAELQGHSARVLQLAVSPDGETVASAAADETIRLWKCFKMDEVKGGKKDGTGSSSSSSSAAQNLNFMSKGIR